MDGGELAERARDLDPTLRIVLMAGVGDPHLDELLSGYRDLPFLRKPVSFGDLYDRLQDLLGTPVRAWLSAVDGAARAPCAAAHLRSPRGLTGYY
jgi:FixJ family two-component response regulator